MDDRVFREALCRMQLFGGVNEKTNRLELVFFLRQGLHGMRFFTRHNKTIQFELLGPESFFLQEALGGMQLFCLAQQKIPVP